MVLWKITGRIVIAVGVTHQQGVGVTIVSTHTHAHTHSPKVGRCVACMINMPMLACVVNDLPHCMASVSSTLMHCSIVGQAHGLLLSFAMLGMTHLRLVMGVNLTFTYMF